jgi:hypothetical protein
MEPFSKAYDILILERRAVRLGIMLNVGSYCPVIDPGQL